MTNMTAVPFHSKALNKTVYAIPDTKNGEYRVCFDPEGRNYWMNMSHIMIKNMDGATLPPVLREAISIGRLLSFSQYRSIEPPNVKDLQRAYDAFTKQGMTRDAAIRNVERDYKVMQLNVNDAGKITFFGFSMPEGKDVTVEIDPVC